MRNYVEGTTVPFGGLVHYTCKPGYFFGKDMAMSSYNITCKNDGTFEMMGGGWENCYHPTGN